MVQANELRPKNIVKDQYGKNIVVESVGEYGINLTTLEGDLSWDYDLDKIFGIPLTPEILERYGFEKKVGDHWRIDSFFEKKINFGNRLIRIDQVKKSKSGNISFYAFLLENNKYSFKESAMIGEVEYLHRLQNIWLDFTFQELEIKELQITI